MPVQASVPACACPLALLSPSCQVGPDTEAQSCDHGGDKQESKKNWAKLCFSSILHLSGCLGPNVVIFIEGLHLQGDVNPLQLLSNVGQAMLEAREIFILSFTTGHRPGKPSDGTGDFGHFACRES